MPLSGEETADFTGRELIMSSLYEKCYHTELTRLIEEGKRDFYNLEQKFIDKMVARLTACEDEYY